MSIQDTLIIHSKTKEGGKFRPSDWIDRMASLGGSYDGQRLVYSQHLYPDFFESERCLFVKKSLQDSEPELYNHVLKFAAQNKLHTTQK